MKNLLLFLSLASLALVLAGCTGPSGPQFSSAKDTFPALKADSARLYVYRTDVIGSVVVPSVKINGTEAGQAVPHGFFYVDLPAGKYEIATGWHPEEITHVRLEAGQVRYVRLKFTPSPFGLYLDPVVVDDRTGQSEIADCSWARRW